MLKLLLYFFQDVVYSMEFMKALPIYHLLDDSSKVIEYYSHIFSTPSSHHIFIPVCVALLGNGLLEFDGCFLLVFSSLRSNLFSRWGNDELECGNVR